MLEKLFVLPILLHMLQIVLIGVMMGRARFRAVRSGRAKREDVAINDNAWPTKVLLIAKNFNNQFQIPVIWYVLSIFILLFKQTDIVLVVLSWLFLLSRLVHSFIHLTSNKLPDRFYAYLVGFIVIGIMWFWFAVKYFLGS